MDRRFVDRQPVYLQLREILRAQIESGEYPPGAKLPSENELAALYKIGRLTIRSSLSALALEGLVRSVQGKGVFVLGPKIPRDMETLGGFKQTMTAQNRRASTRILERSLRPAGPYYARLFGMDAKEGLFYVRRLLRADDEPVSLEEVFVRQAAVPKFSEFDPGVFSIYEIYDMLHVTVTEAVQRLDLAVPDVSQARLLGTQPGQAVLHFRCLSSNEAGEVLEYASTYTRSDMCSYSIHFEKRGCNGI
ncbi:MAG: GntR family transcriptional regulator [Clostridiaceae bacterium]|nr:GntR family transcriptional regulator [Eubacteriales bacterium]